MQALINLLTAEQIQASKENRMVWFTNAAQRKAVEKAGFSVVIKDKKNSYLANSVNNALSVFLRQHGHAVKVVSITQKYSDNNGAYEVAILADSEDREFKVNNMYDQSVCFREMTHVELIEYANKQ